MTGREFEGAIDVHQPMLDADQRLHDIPLENINLLPQHRRGANPVQMELLESVHQHGLINPISVAYVDGESLGEIVDFTNRVWGGEASMDDFQQYGDRYVVLIAGHSRYHALRKLNDEGFESPHANGLAETKVFPVDSPADFMSLQLAENIHSAPPSERVAKGYAEAFLYRKQAEPELTPAAFARENGVSGEAVRNALAFVELPDSLRKAVEDELLPFSVACELGRTAEVIRQHAQEGHAFELFGVDDEIAQEKIEDFVETELVHLAAQYDATFNRRTKPAISEIRRIRGLRQETIDGKNGEVEVLTMFSETYVSVMEQKRRAIAKLVREVEGVHAVRQRELASRLGEIASIDTVAA